jgi:radical SAM superfamily enzyme YgiQ (UPF0313 family)
MEYIGQIYRPPAEHNSLLLQVTVGCSHNDCGFCEMYRDKQFKVKSFKQIEIDLDYAAKYHSDKTRVFLCDGDAMVLSQKKLIKILTLIAEKLPWVKTVSSYVYEKNLQNKTTEDLIELRNLNLKVLHMGLESGHSETLAYHGKQSNPEFIVEQGRKIKDADIKLSLTVILGLGSHKHSLDHGRETGRVISEIDPNFVGVLSLMITPGTPLFKKHNSGEFTTLSLAEEMLELKEMVKNTNMTRGVFSVNHNSNAIPIQARFPREKESTLQFLESAVIQLKQMGC